MSTLGKLRDLNKLHAFVRVAERRSFTRAAEELHTTPSMVSKHMRDLEADLGFSVLSRSTHGVALTDAGEGLFRNCCQLFANLDEYVVEARNQQSGPFGSLRVQAPGDVARWILSPLVASFVRLHPQVRVELSAEAATLQSLENGFDVIVASKKPPTPGVVEREIGRIVHVVCATPDYLETSGMPRTPQDLRNHNCLVNTMSAVREWPFQTGGQQVSVEVKGTVSSNSSAVLIDVALNHAGIIRVPLYSVEAELANGSLERLFGDETSSPERLLAYFPKTKHCPEKITEFVGFLARRFTGG